MVPWQVRGLSHSSRLESQARVSDWPINTLSQSHSKLVKKMSYAVQENVDGDAPTLPRQRVFSQTNLALALPFVPLPILKGGQPSGDMSSDESDGEEHIVEIGSPSTLFHSHHLTPSTRPERFLSWSMEMYFAVLHGFCSDLSTSVANQRTYFSLGLNSHHPCFYHAQQ